MGWWVYPIRNMENYWRASHICCSASIRIWSGVLPIRVSLRRLPLVRNFPFKKYLAISCIHAAFVWNACISSYKLHNAWVLLTWLSRKNPQIKTSRPIKTKTRLKKTHETIRSICQSTSTNQRSTKIRDVEKVPKLRFPLQTWAPPSYKWHEITPIRSVKSPQIPIYNTIYRGYDCIYNWEGPPSKLLTVR